MLRVERRICIGKRNSENERWKNFMSKDPREKHLEGGEAYMRTPLNPWRKRKTVPNKIILL